jgi:MFS family permease
MFLSRRLITRFSIKPVMLAGLAFMVAGQFHLSHIAEGGTYAGGVLPGLVLTTFGMGLVFPTVSVGITSRLGRGDQGLAGGLIPTAQQVGMAIGLAVLATIAAAVSRGHGGSLVDGYRVSYLVGTSLVVLALVLVAATSFAAPAGEPAAEEVPGASELEGSAA